MNKGHKNVKNEKWLISFFFLKKKGNNEGKKSQEKDFFHYIISWNKNCAKKKNVGI
jgi:hypothetical protein